MTARGQCEDSTEVIYTDSDQGYDSGLDGTAGGDRREDTHR